MSKKLIIKTPITNANEDYLLNLPDKDSGTFTIATISDVEAEATARQTADNAINAKIPNEASSSNQLADKSYVNTNFGHTIVMSLDSSTYKVYLSLKDKDGNVLGTQQEIDLPLESVVVSGSYDSSTKEVVLTLKDGSTVRFSIADLVDGLVSESQLNTALELYYTKSETDTELVKKVDKTITINGHALLSNVTVTKSDIELGNVDNTSDLNKPISTATQEALDLKANKNGELPHYEIQLEATNVYNFVNSHSLFGKPFIIYGVAGIKGSYLCYFYYMQNGESRYRIQKLGFDSDLGTEIWKGSSDLNRYFSNLMGTGSNSYKYEYKNNKVTEINSSSTDEQYPSAKCVYDALIPLTYEEALIILEGVVPPVFNCVGTYNYSVGGTVYTTLTLNDNLTGTYVYGSETITFTYEATEDEIILHKQTGSVSNYEIFIDSEDAVSTELVIDSGTVMTIKLQVKGRVSTKVQSFVRAA